MLNYDSFTNKYYNTGIQFFEVTKCVGAILPQRVKLFEIISCFTGFTMKLVQNQKWVTFRVMEKNRGIGYLNIFQFGLRLRYMYLNRDITALW